MSRKMSSKPSSRSSTVRMPALRTSAAGADCARMPTTTSGRNARCVRRRRRIETRDDRQRAVARRIVGVRGDADDHRTGADREQILGQRRDQRDDAVRSVAVRRARPPRRRPASRRREEREDSHGEHPQAIRRAGRRACAANSPDSRAREAGWNPARSRHCMRGAAGRHSDPSEGRRRLERRRSASQDTEPASHRSHVRLAKRLVCRLTRMLRSAAFSRFRRAAAVAPRGSAAQPSPSRPRPRPQIGRVFTQRPPARSGFGHSDETPTYVVDALSIEAFGYRTIAEALANVPGDESLRVRSIRLAGRTTASAARRRRNAGAAGRRADRDRSNGAVDLGSLSTAGMQRIEDRRERRIDAVRQRARPAA